MKGQAAQIARPRADVRLYLLHGADEAGAGALARQLGEAIGADVERVDLDAALLRKQPGRLADEAASLSLFGGARLIRVAPGGEELLEALTLLLDAPRAEHPVVVIAPGVRTTARIVKLALDAPNALAIACHPPNDDALERIANSALTTHGIRAAPGVARRLAESAGGDRDLIAREAEKLALYLDAAPDRPQAADHDALDAIGADLGDAEATRLVDALLDGKSDATGAELVRLAEAVTSPISWLRQLQRKLVLLGELHAAIARGASADAAMKQQRVAYPQIDRTARALRRWNPAMIASGLARIRATERAVMAAGNAGPVLADAAMLALAQAIERRG